MASPVLNNPSVSAALASVPRPAAPAGLSDSHIVQYPTGETVAFPGSMSSDELNAAAANVWQQLKTRAHNVAKSVEAGVAPLVQSAAEVSTPAIAQQLYKKLKGQPNTLSEVPGKVVAFMAPLVAGPEAEAEFAEPDVAAPAAAAPKVTRGVYGTSEEMGRGLAKALSDHPAFNPELTQPSVADNIQLTTSKGLAARPLFMGPKDEIPLTSESGVVRGPRSKISGSTVRLLSNPLPIEEPTISNLADALNDFRKSQGLRPVDSARFPQKALDRATSIGNEELGHQIEQPESGREWYRSEINRYEKAVQQDHPETADPAKMTIFKAINAGTSLGNRSETAVENALNVFDHYKQTGEIPLVNPETGKGWPNGQYNAYQNTFRTLQSVIDDKGEDEAAQWLQEKHPIKELRQYNKNVAGKANDMEYGAMALGPKAGPFFLNMNGVAQKLTADVWFTRTWNRWMGTMFNESGELVEVPRNESERDLMTQAVEQLANKWGIDTRDAQAILWNYEQKLYTAHGIPSEQPSYGAAAETVVKKRTGAK